MDFIFDLITVAVFTSVAWYAWLLWYRPRLIAETIAITTRDCFRIFEASLHQAALEQLNSRESDDSAN